MKKRYDTSLNFLPLLVLIFHANAVKTDGSSEFKVKFSPNDLSFPVSQTETITLLFYGSKQSDTNLTFSFSESGILEEIPSKTVPAGLNDSLYIVLKPRNVGHTVVFINSTDMIDLSEAYARVSISHTDTLDYVSDVIGWLYFVAWSISFYPQVILNFKRRSVIGLHFDFLALNVVGFMFYSIFNIALFWSPLIKAQYFQRHPFGVNPVQLNDVIFSIHAFFACLVQVVQCLLFDRGDQKISAATRVILVTIVAFSVFAAIFVFISSVQWLDFLYFVSYVKLFITLIKYIPQAYYNYRRKSTSGWSIGNVLLDFTGGTLSIAQMIIIAYNYNDWTSIFGDPTKFGLGLFSMIFDVFFMVQHYILYRNSRHGVTLVNYPDQSLRDSTSPLITDSVQSSYGAIH
ncbi:cystinosin homolog isoform X1 [Hyalella azteca]|uniref:Cystinosin homolog n=1 Tax=Hyalella azteca TaxID=294128 RepID=A0A8B7NEE1_HYAAZ|nr:cystinosin homolog isoform X1 [Hyalella azteca]